MEHNEKVRDIMIPLEEHPRIPFSCTIGEALVELRDFIHKGFRHVLVFDARFRLVSILSLKDILKNMMPDFLRLSMTPKFEGFAVPDSASLALLWQESFFTECRHAYQKPITSMLNPVHITIEADAPVAQALYLMLKEDVNMLPVDEKGIVVGVIRITHILDMVLKSCALRQDIM